MVFLLIYSFSYFTVTIDKLSAVVKDPEALLPRNVTAHEASVYALGRICLFHIDEIKNPWVQADFLAFFCSFPGAVTCKSPIIPNL